MTTYLDEILDPSLLGEMLDKGYIQVRYHPDFLYAIYCYTKKAMFDREWNEATRICRGLIVNEETSEVLARPFKKFFNYGEPSAPVFGPKDLVEVTDKMDGSLGILFNTPEGLQIATKGSFRSTQADWATAWLTERLRDTEWTPPDGVTFLFEIVYPENRIVLDYGKTEGLFFLGSVDIATGRDVELDPWDDPFPTTEFFGKGQYGFVMGNVIKDRPNKEGFVLRRLSDDERLKIKQEDYIELHRVMTGLNERQLWEWLSQGRTIAEILADLPEEMHNWAEPILMDLVDQYLALDYQIDCVYRLIKDAESRKDFAIAAQAYVPVIASALFLRRDGQDVRLSDHIWKVIKP